MGTIVKIVTNDSNSVTNDSNSVTKVIVEFDNTNVGLKYLQISPLRSTFPGGVHR